MFGKYFLLALLLLKYAELFQPFPCLCSLIQFALSLTIFPVFIQDRQEIFTQESRWVKCSLIHGSICTLFVKRLLVHFDESLV